MTTSARRREMEEEEQTLDKKTKIDQRSQHQQEVDRISELPDDILHPIMSLLTLKEACITTALSQRWRNLFPTLPRLHFNDSSFDYSSVRSRPSRDQEIGIDRWLGSVCDILESRRVPVRTCTIRSVYFDEYAKEIGDIIRFLCNDGIQELSIYNMGNHYTLPSSLYFCQTLTRIELYRCFLKVPARFSLLRRLNELKVEWCIVDASDLQRLISGCRAVERLTLEHCYRFRNLVVDVPKLAVLDVTSHRPFELSIVNAPLLESVAVRFRHDNVNKYFLDEDDPEDGSDTEEEDNDAVSRLVTLLKSLGGIQKLTLEFQNRYLKTWRMEGLALPETLGSILPKMKKLTLKMQLDLTITVSTVWCLLNSCPNLEDLVIVLDKDVNDHQCPEFSVLNYWDRKSPSDCMRNTLCTATFYLEEGCCWTLGIEFVNFLLENARVLKNLVIDCCHLEVGLSMFEDLHREMFLLQPASRNVVMELKTAKRRMFYRPARITFDLR